MKNKLQRLIALSLTVILSTSILVACSKVEVKNDVPVATIGSAIDAKISTASQIANPDPDYIKTYFEVNPTVITEYVLKVCMTDNYIDEYGVFKAASLEQVEEVKAMVEAMVKTKQDAWLNLYLTEQYPKLRDAIVHVKGQYVMYSVLSAEDRALAVAEMDALLTAK